MTGPEQSQEHQLYRYLMQMSEQLNEAMNGMSMANFTESAKQEIREMAGGGTTTKQIGDAKNALRSMIIKTAEIVRTEMDEISTELRGQYTGISDEFGRLDRDLTARIEANAQGILQNYEYIETIQSNEGGFDGFMRRINERIFSGIIGYDTLGYPQYGIAIGENVTAYDNDGNPYINDNAKMATFTKERLSFWQGTAEVAYFSNRKLYITSCEILKEMTMGNYIWMVQADGSLGLMVNT